MDWWRVFLLLQPSIIKNQHILKIFSVITQHHSNIGTYFHDRRSGSYDLNSYFDCNITCIFPNISVIYLRNWMLVNVNINHTLEFKKDFIICFKFYETLCFNVQDTHWLIDCPCKVIQYIVIHCRSYLLGPLPKQPPFWKVLAPSSASLISRTDWSNLSLGIKSPSNRKYSWRRVETDFHYLHKAETHFQL